MSPSRTILLALLLALALSAHSAQAKTQSRADATQVLEQPGLLKKALPAFARVVRHSLSSLRMAAPPRPRPSLHVAPVPGELTSRFGMRDDPVRKRRRRRGKRRRMHKGLDFAADRHTPIVASGNGVVLSAGVKGGYGRLVIIDHGNGITTRYAHMQRLRVKKGQFVPAGTVIGTVGSSGRVTGPHLHFEVRVDGQAVDPNEMVDFRMPPCRARSRDCRPQS